MQTAAGPGPGNIIDPAAMKLTIQTPPYPTFSKFKLPVSQSVTPTITNPTTNTAIETLIVFSRF
jgi:hypothetical protein